MDFDFELSRVDCLFKVAMVGEKHLENYSLARLEIFVVCYGDVKTT